MSDSLLSLIFQTSHFLWLLLNGVLISAAVMFFRMDRRSHTVCLMIGFSLQVLMSLWYLVMPILSRIGTMGDLSPITYTAAPVGINLIAYALITYGLFTIALIQWRKFKAPKFEDEK